MSFVDQIDKMRERPERERRRLALVWTGALMVPIVLFWILTKTIPGITDARVETEASKEGGGLGASVLGIWQEVKEGALLIGEQIEALQETTITPE